MNIYKELDNFHKLNNSLLDKNSIIFSILHEYCISGINKITINDSQIIEIKNIFTKYHTTKGAMFGLHLNHEFEFLRYINDHDIEVLHRENCKTDFEFLFLLILFVYMEKLACHPAGFINDNTNLVMRFDHISEAQLCLLFKSVEETISLLNNFLSDEPYSKMDLMNQYFHFREKINKTEAWNKLTVLVVSITLAFHSQIISGIYASTLFTKAITFTNSVEGDFEISSSRFKNYI